MGTIRKANATSFRPGHAGGPGRPRGARSKLQELAIEMLRDDFEKFGAEAIARVRQERPHHYLSVVASLLPRMQITEKVSPFSDVSDEELGALEEYLAVVRAKTIRRLELVADKDVEPKDAT